MHPLLAQYHGVSWSTVIAIKLQLIPQLCSRQPQFVSYVIHCPYKQETYRVSYRVSRNSTDFIDFLRFSGTEFRLCAGDRRQVSCVALALFIAITQRELFLESRMTAMIFFNIYRNLALNKEIFNIVNRSTFKNFLYVISSNDNGKDGLSLRWPLLFQYALYVM